MVYNILDYIGAYDNVRAACGLSSEELSDEELALSIYRNSLSMALGSVSGVYAPSGATTQTLDDIFTSLADTDEMWMLIQQYSIFLVASTALTSVGLKAYKTMSDGKSTLTRFSPESTYLSARQSVSSVLHSLTSRIGDLIGISVVEPLFIAAVPPSPDRVVGE